MSQEKLQSYFSAHDVSRIGHGKQAQVYGGGSLIIKDFRAGIIGLLISKLLVPGQEAKLTATQRARDAYKQGKEVLGGLAVPYELADTLSTRILSDPSKMGGYRSIEKRTFSNVVVQEAVKSEDFIICRLQEHVRKGELKDIQDILDAIIDFGWKLNAVGAHPLDFGPDDYVTDGRNLQTTDIGKFLFSRKEMQTDKMFNSSTIQRMELIAYRSQYQVILGELSDHPQIDTILNGFMERMSEFFNPQRSLRSFGSKSRRAKPVPELLAA